MNLPGGLERIRTAVKGFADLRLATRPRDPLFAGAKVIKKCRFTKYFSLKSYTVNTRRANSLFGVLGKNYELWHMAKIILKQIFPVFCFFDTLRFYDVVINLNAAFDFTHQNTDQFLNDFKMNDLNTQAKNSRTVIVLTM